MEFFTVPAGYAALLVRFECCFGGVGFAQHDVGVVGKAMQSFYARLCVRNVVEIFRDVFSGAVVLVVSAAALLHYARFAQRGGLGLCWRRC